MAKPGPKRAPTHLKVVRGEREDRIPDAPTASLGELTRPGWLMTEAKREWNRIVPQLKRWGLGVVDRAALAMLCQEWARYVEAQKAVDEHGLTFTTEKGYVQQRPEVGMANKHLTNVRKLCSEFGLTLSSRGNIVVPETGDVDDAEQLLSS